jgi:CubicO group peptidase (beta-lactamase class C family)
VPNSTRTRYAAASLTKPITEIVTMRLADAGKLRLDDPIARWLPAFPHGAEITVRQLVDHTSGIPHRVTEDADEMEPHTAAEMVAFAARKPLLFAPGSRKAYSSAGYSVLARVLELASGRSYADLVEGEVFRPAKAELSTAVGDARHLIPQRAQGYLRDARGPIRAPVRDLSYLIGAGSLYTTPRDLWQIQRRLLAGGYGRSALAALLDDGNLEWDGTTSGYRGFADHLAEGELSFIFLGNYPTGAVNLLREQLRKVLAGDPPARIVVPDPAPAPLDDAVAHQLAGRYELRPGTVQQLRVQGGTVWLGEWVLVPIGRDSFCSPLDYSTIQAHRDAAGVVDGLTWQLGGRSILARRLGE